MHTRSPTWESAWICTHDSKHEKKGREKDYRKARKMSTILAHAQQERVHSAIVDAFCVPTRKPRSHAGEVAWKLKGIRYPHTAKASLRVRSVGFSIFINGQRAALFVQLVRVSSRRFYPSVQRGANRFYR